MSSSINGLNSSAFRALTQHNTESSARHSRVHHRHHGVHGDEQAAQSQGTESTDTRGTDTRGSVSDPLARAKRDVSLTLRSMGRETNHLLRRIGTNTELADKVKTLSSDFEKSLNERYDAFVQSGGQNYMEFVEQTVVARREFHAQLREIARGLPDRSETGESESGCGASHDSTDSVTTTSGDTTTTTTGGITGGTTSGTAASGTDRAQRDIEALVLGLDRDARQIAGTFGEDSDAVAKFNGMRDGFIESIKKEFDALAQGQTSSYMEFAERVVALRQAFSRDLRSTFPDPSTTGSTSGTDPVAGVSDVKAPVEPDAKANTAAVTEDAPVTDQSGSGAPTEPNRRNIERAQRDAEALLRGLDRDSSRLMSAMGDSPESREVAARAEAFRSLLAERLKSFVDGGGTDYMAFAEQMAVARRSVGSFFAQLAGPKIDRLG